MHRKPHSKGFTLVELMIVISIIVVLITMVAIVIPLAMDKVKQLETRSKVDKLNTMIRQFGHDKPDDSETSGTGIRSVKNTRLFEDLLEKNAGMEKDALIDGWGNAIMYDRIWEKNAEVEEEEVYDPDAEETEEDTGNDFTALEIVRDLPGHPVMLKIKKEKWEWAEDTPFEEDDPIRRYFEKYEYVIWSLGSEIYLDDDEEDEDDYDFEDDIITWGLRGN